MPDIDPGTAMLALVAGGGIQAVFLALHRREKGGSAATLTLAGSLLVTAGAALLLLRATLWEWLAGALAPLLFMTGLSLAVSALGAAAEGTGGVDANRKANAEARRAPFLRTMLGAAAFAWAARTAAGRFAASGLFSGFAGLERFPGLADAALVAFLTGLAAYILLRATESSALKVASGILCGALSLGAIASGAFSFLDGTEWPGMGDGQLYALAFIVMQCLSFVALLLAKESSDARHFASATHDALTGIFNRNGFTEAVGKSLSMCSRQNTPYTIIHFDIEGFREINAARGHAAGDRVLRDFAAKLGSRIRPYDHLCRMGGDRFYLFLQTVNRELAPPVLGRLVAGIGLPSKEVVAYRISAGAACVDYPSGQNIALDDLFVACDGALLEAKRKGGSRIELAPF